MADRRLQVFYTVARQLSFTRAAEQLCMTQPAVTFQIKQLEEHFDARLFERDRGGIALTPAGKMVLQYAERILELSDELDKRVEAVEVVGREVDAVVARDGDEAVQSGIHGGARSLGFRRSSARCCAPGGRRRRAPARGRPVRG